MSELVWSQQTQDIVPMLVECWATAIDADPAISKLYQHWYNVLCLLGHKNRMTAVDR